MKRTGSCPPGQCRGECCTFLMQIGPQPDRNELDFLAWRGIETKYIGHGATAVKVPLVCEKLDRETGRCTIYADRPQVCRDFPTTPVDLVFLPHCGYRFEAE